MFHKDIWGTRSVKYRFLEENNINNIDIISFETQKPLLFFVPTDYTIIEKYNKGISIKSIFNEDVRVFLEKILLFDPPDKKLYPSGATAKILWM